MEPRDAGVLSSTGSSTGTQEAREVRLGNTADIRTLSTLLHQAGFPLALTCTRLCPAALRWNPSSEKAPVSEGSPRKPKREPTAIDGRLEPDLMAELVAELAFLDPRQADVEADEVPESADGEEPPLVADSAGEDPV
jgi:hypothetical protein